MLGDYGQRVAYPSANQRQRVVSGQVGFAGSPQGVNQTGQGLISQRSSAFSSTVRELAFLTGVRPHRPRPSLWKHVLVPLLGQFIGLFQKPLALKLGKNSCLTGPDTRLGESFCMRSRAI